MARKYKYTDAKNGRLLFETTQPNYVSEDEVNKMFHKRTGRDWRLEKALIDREIRMVSD